MKCFVVEGTFNNKWIKKTGKRALSLDYALENRLLEGAEL